MNPLSAFQVLVITMAAAMFVEAVKPEQKAKSAFWMMFAFLALLGVATNAIAGAWPTASKIMIWVGSSPITFLIFMLGWVAYLQKPWRRVKAGGIDVATLTSAEYNSLSEDIRKMGLSISGLSEFATRAQSKNEETAAFVIREAGDLRAKLDALKAEYTSHHSLSADALREQFDNIYLALGAIGNWERINRLGNEIDSLNGNERGRSLIVNPYKGIFPFMATRAPLKPASQNRTLTYAELRVRAVDAVREERSVDYGSLSPEERDRLLADRFGI